MAEPIQFGFDSINTNFDQPGGGAPANNGISHSASVPAPVAKTNAAPVNSRATKPYDSSRGQLDLTDKPVTPTSWTDDAWRGLKHGVTVTAPKMVGEALQFAGADEMGQSLVNDAQSRENDDNRESAYGQSQDGTFSVRGNVYEAADNGVMSMLPGVAGAGVGFLLGGPAGALLGYGLGSAAALPVFYGSQAQSTYENVKKAQLAAGVDPILAEQQARQAGHINGAIEAGGELVADAIPFAKLFKPVEKVGAKAAGSLVMDALMPTLKRGAAQVAHVAAGEVGTEMAQQAGEDAVEGAYGSGPGATWENTSKVIMPTLLMAGVPGTAGAAAKHVQVNAARRTLMDPESDPTLRAKIATAVAGEIAGQDEQASRDFALYAAKQIDAKQPIEIQGDDFYRAMREQDAGLPPGGSAGSALQEQANQPNSPLTRATLRANPQLAGPDPITLDANQIQSVARSTSLLNGLRAMDQQSGAEEGQGLTQSFLSSLSMALNTNAPQPTREQALQALHSLIAQVTGQPVPLVQDADTAPAPAAQAATPTAPAAAPTEASATQPNSAAAAPAEAPVAPVQREQVVAPKVAIPDGPEPAAVRKRRAELQAMVSSGFATVERRDDGSRWLVNEATNQEMPVNPGDAQRATAMIQRLVEEKAKTAELHPDNPNQETSQKKLEKEDYEKSDVISINGMRVQLENPRGSTRSGTGPDGKTWSTTMAHHYGEFVGTEGADSDPIDTFIGPRPDSNKVYVIDQLNKDGTFDEHKVMMGFTSEEEARQGYLDNYEKGWTGLGAITEMTTDQFKDWAQSDRAQLPANQEMASRVEQPSHYSADELEGVQQLRASLAQARPGLRLSLVQDTDARLQSFRPIMDLFAGLTGQRVVPVHVTGKGAFDGVQYGGHYYVNLDAPVMPLAWTMAHEFKHLSEQFPGLAKLYDRIWDLIPASAREEYFQRLKRTGEVQSDSFAKATPQEVDTVRSEMTADFLGQRFMDRKWLQDLAKQKPALFGEFVRDWLRLLGNAINAIRAKLMAKESPLGIVSKDVDRMMRDHLEQLEQMKAIAAEVAIAWAERNPGLAERLGVVEQDPQFAHRAGPLERSAERQFLVPQLEGRFNDGTGNIAVLPAFAVKGLQGEQSFRSLPVRIRVGQHGNQHPQGRRADQFGATHRLAHARHDPTMRGYDAPDLGAGGPAEVERSVRDIALTVLTANQAYGDKDFAGRVLLHSPVTGNAVVLNRETDAKGQPFWSVKTLFKKKASSLNSTLGSPAPIKGITLDGTARSNADADVRETTHLLRSSVPFLGDEGSYTVSQNGTIVNPESEGAPATAPAQNQAKTARAPLVRDANGKIILNKNKAQLSAREGVFHEAVQHDDEHARDDGSLGESPAAADRVRDGQGRSDAYAGRADRGVHDATREQSEPGVYGTPREGAVSAVGYHFSQQARQRLSSEFYGTGLRGAERARLEGDANADIRPRIMFYVDKGNGIQPEAGVGGHPHKLEMRNLYDASRDNLGLVRQAVQGITDLPQRLNAFERAILQAGFDGYLSRDAASAQDFAVLVGRHNPMVIPGVQRPVVDQGASAYTTHRAGNELVRRPTNEQIVPLVRARPEILQAAPSFKMEFGEARVHESEAAAANAVLADRKVDFHFSAREADASDNQPQRATINLDALHVRGALNHDVTMPIALTDGSTATMTVNAQSAYEQIQAREEALEMVRGCLL